MTREPLRTSVVSPSRILLAEDYIVNQRVAARILEKEGHSVVIASNGTEALAAWRNQPFDMILMDVQMPERDGFQTTAEIRRAESGTNIHVPIFAMTAHAMRTDAHMRSTAASSANKNGTGKAGATGNESKAGNHQS